MDRKTLLARPDLMTPSISPYEVVLSARPITAMFEQTFKNIDDVLWKEAGCTTELSRQRLSKISQEIVRMLDAD